MSNISFAFFWIPARFSEVEVEELNCFLGSHRVLMTDRKFLPDPSAPGWSICIEYAYESSGKTNVSRKQKIDYRNVLDSKTFAVYAALRNTRKELAHAEGIPAYVIMTNEQMAELARLCPENLVELSTIDGFGEGRIKKYGQQFIDCLHSENQSKNSAGKSPTENETKK